MIILIAPDAFKECLNAKEVARIIADGLRRGGLKHDLLQTPLADGGEGTAEVILQHKGGAWRECRVNGPLGQPVIARYGLCDDGETAVIEMAQASGLHLLSKEDQNPLKTTTFGTGEMILDALEQGVSRIIVGLGGSGTVDGGAGLAQALGIGLLDADGNPIGRGGGALKKLAHIDLGGRSPELLTAELVAACDVANPLLGGQGAVAIYGPQKGATPEMAGVLEEGLSHFADVVEQEVGRQCRNEPGAGAAGGLGFGLLAFFSATLRPGIELVFEEIAFNETVERANLIITGEGRVDEQTVAGKVVAGVAMAATKHGKPVIVLCGAKTGNLEPLFALGPTAILDSVPAPLTLDEALAHAERHLSDQAEQLGRLLRFRLNMGSDPT